MKKIIITAVIAFSISACGQDNLSNSRAESILKECSDKKPEQRYVYLQKGEVLIDPSAKPHLEKIKLYKELERKGYLTFKLTTKKHPIYVGAQFYNLALTGKASEYIDQSKKNGNHITLKSFRYDVDEIEEVQVMPALNTAKVKVKYKPNEITPFSILPGGSPEQKYTRSLSFIKTNDGWKYCD